MTGSFLLAASQGVLLGGGLLVAAFPWRDVAAARATAVLAAVSGVLSGALAVRVLLGGPLESTWLARPLIDGLPFSFTLRVDVLAALFLLLLAFVSAAVAIYAAGHFGGRRFGSLLLLLVAAMTLVVTAADWVIFLFAWEVMTLASYGLVVQSGEERAARAGWVYLLTTHVAGSGILLAATSLSVVAGSYGFGPTAAALSRLLQTSPAFAHTLVALFAVGFGTKAAVYPFSFWLPEAYSAAPAPASGLFSGLMAKMGLYGLIRLFFMLPASEPSTVGWGLVLATLGAASMLVGNIRCLAEVEAKRLVAQSSIGQIGYIVLGLGMAVALGGFDPRLSALAFAGALFHLINHGLIKPLLFLTVGSIERRAGTQDLRQLGGLVRLMPGVAAATLLGGLAIAGTPPLNGFASKWLLYQAAVFGGIRLPLLALYGVLAIFLSTVSLAAYLKYFGTAFLGEEGPAVATGTGSRATAWAQGLLAAGVVVLGLWPAPVVAGALAVLGSAPGAALYGNVTTPVLLGGVLGSGAYQPLGVLLALILGGGVAALVVRLAAAPAVNLRPWYGGEQLAAAEARYGAAQLYQPFAARFAPLLRGWFSPRWRPPGWLARLVDVDRWLVEPVASAFLWVSRGFSRLHRGRVRGYLAWQLLTVLAVVLLLIGVEGGYR